MEDYYIAELPAIFRAWEELRGGVQDEAQAVDPMAFFGTGGERVDG